MQANYTDPQSKLRFSTIEEFSYIRRLPSDVVTGYLALRKENDNKLEVFYSVNNLTLEYLSTSNMYGLFREV